jgi:pimeloyl-ACP methyl ester carboxylesterase
VKKHNKLKKFMLIIGLTGLTLVLAWIILAALSGMFIPHDNRYAVKPGEISPDIVSSHKHIANLKNFQVACFDTGSGEPVILLHGCPFSVNEWQYVIPALAKKFRVIAPDLIGLGDTPVRLNDNYLLTEDVKMVEELMDQRGIKSAYFIGHDHGGAILQLIMQHAPDRIKMAVLTNVEAYDQWPSKPEISDLKLITNPITSPLFYQAFKFRAIQRKLYSVAVVNKDLLTDETLDGFTKQHLMTPLRWQRLRIFFDGQLNPGNNHLTLEAVPALRKFNKPVLILWGQQDTNFGPQIALQLARDIPGVLGIHWMKNSAHLPMLEEPKAYSTAALNFFSSGEVASAARQALLEVKR